MFPCDATPVVFRNIPAFGDTQQRVVGFEIVRRREVDLVGCDDRNEMAVGEFQQLRLDLLLGARSVPLHFHVEPVAERPLQKQKPFFGVARLTVEQRPVDRAVRPARESDHAVGMRRDLRSGHERRVLAFRAQMRCGDELHQVGIAHLVHRKEREKAIAPRVLANRRAWNRAGFRFRLGQLTG